MVNLTGILNELNNKGEMPEQKDPYNILTKINYPASEQRGIN
jgi:hypothetical protein